MAGIADIMTVYAPCFAELLLMADRAFHLSILNEVFERCLTDDAFFLHGNILVHGFSIRYVHYKAT